MRRYGAAALLLVAAVVLIAIVPTASEAPTPTVGLTIPVLSETTIAGTTPVFAGDNFDLSPDWTRAGPIQGGLEIEPQAVVVSDGAAYVWGALPGGERKDLKRINLADGVVSEVAEPPSGDCTHSLAVDNRLLAWSTCEPGPIFQFDGALWSTLTDHGGFAILDAEVVWTGSDLWFWQQGIRLSLSSGALTKVSTPPVTGSAAFADGELLLLPVEGAPVISDGGSWSEIESPPMGPQGRQAIATPDGIVAVNNRWETALWDDQVWTRLESAPLRLGSAGPNFVPTTGPVVVRGSVGGAMLSGPSWQPLIDPYVGMGLGRPDGSWFVAGSRLFQVESTLISRLLPQRGGEAVDSRAIPLQALALAIPEGWSANLVSGGSESRFAYSLTDGSTICEVAALRGEGGRSLVEKVVVQSAWNGLPMTVRLDTFPEGWMAAVDYATGTSDLVQVSCAARDVALLLAAQVYSPPELTGG